MTKQEGVDILNSYTDRDGSGNNVLRVTIDAPPTFSENLAKVNGAVVDIGIGAAGLGTQRVAIASDSTFSVTIIYPTGTETPSASSVSTGGTVAAGKLSVIFTTSSDFAGSILGITRNPNTIYSFAVVNPGKTLAAIVYTVTAGSMIIDLTV